MTTTEHTTEATGERVVVIPEITIPATAIDTAQRVRDLLAQVVPALDELHAAALELREEYHRALIQLYPYLGGGGLGGGGLGDRH